MKREEGVFQWNRKRYFLIYTILFLGMAYYAFYYYLKAGKSLVGNSDGFYQHLHGLAYYGHWLREVFRNVFLRHRFVIPQWDFNIGMGEGILTTFHYYGFGDPIALLSALVPVRYSLYLYSALMVLRFYLAGVTFSLLCFYWKRENYLGILSGAMCYAFCQWAMIEGVRHPFFQNPLIYLPLVLIGLEKVLRKEKPYLFIASVWISAVCNFYFFYMIVIIAVIYGLVRVGCMRLRKEYGIDRIGAAAGAILRVGLHAVVGVLMSAPILYPMIQVFLTDNRTKMSYNVDLFYKKRYYKLILPAFAGKQGFGNYTYYACGILVVIALLLLFLRRREASHRYLELKLFFVIGLALLGLPFAGHVFNGFAYVANRWIWAFVLLLCFTVSTFWEEMYTMKGRKLVLVSALLVLYLLHCYRYKGIRGQLELLGGMMLVLVFNRILQTVSTQKKVLIDGAARCLVFLLLLGSVSGLTRKAVYPKRQQYFVSYREGESMLYPEADQLAVKYQNASERFSRNAGYTEWNSNVLTQARNYSFYWSISGGWTSDFFKQFQVLVFRNYKYKSLDNRVMLMTLASTEHYIRKKMNSPVPFGYSLAGKEQEYEVYRNDYSLPLAFTYDTYLTAEDLEDMNGSQREEAVMQSLLMEEEPQGYEKGRVSLSGKREECRVLKTNGVEFEDGRIKVTKKDAVMVIKIPQNDSGNQYLSMQGLSFEGRAPETQIHFKIRRADGRKTRSRTVFDTPKAKWRSGNENLLINMGYQEDVHGFNTIKVIFEKKGTYRWKDMYGWTQPMEIYKEAAAERAADAWEDEVIDANKVSGNITVPKKKLLFFSIPYSRGWTAKVDGKKMKLYRSNENFMSLELEEGEHHVELKYTTPGLKPGIWMALCGMAVLICMIVHDFECTKKRTKKRKNFLHK
ncbi:MAG: YfhO family protein [Eubacteriales bacterium]|nr:YfhO family protein [Eubacteriales bacterium]